MYGFIYLTTNIHNGKRYVGLCTHEKPILTEGKLYLGSGTILKYAINKYGRESFTRSILQLCNSELELLEAEINWINNIKPEYNIESGGYAGISERMQQYWNKFTEEERKTARNWNVDHSNWNDPLYSKDMSKVQKDIWKSRDSTYRKKFGEKISNTKKANGNSIGKKNGMYGRSVITERNLKWYTNDKENKYMTEGTEPPGFRRGRTNLSGKIGKRKNAIS